jgi:hypothetical protein
MFDFLKNFKFEWNPDRIISDPLPDTLVSPVYNQEDRDELEVAQALCDHLNEIIDWKDRIDAIDYLSAEAKNNFSNLTYTTAEEGIVNAIISIGGKDGTIDFNLAQTAMNMILDWHDITALDSITGVNNA